jgi:hypothetical protein
MRKLILIILLTGILGMSKPIYRAPIYQAPTYRASTYQVPIRQAPTYRVPIKIQDRKIKPILGPIQWVGQLTKNIIDQVIEVVPDQPIMRKSK